MPKRKNRDSNSDDYILRKIRKLERKIKKRNRKKTLSNESSDNSNMELSPRNDDQLEESVDLINIDDNTELSALEFLPTETHLESDRQDNDPVVSELPSTSVSNPVAPSVPSEPGITLDENILELLGETPSKNKSLSAPIQAELAVRWEHIATSGLSKETKKELLDKHFIPENCQKIGAPKLNPEIKAALSDTLVKKDVAIELKQNQRAIAISCIGQALTKIFASEHKDPDIIKYLIDAARLLCDSQYIESMSRRSFVTSTIKKDIKYQLYSTEIDSYLFGEKLADTLKAAKAINKSGAEIKTTPQQKSNSYSQSRGNQSRSLNTRAPPEKARQVGAGKRQPATPQPRRYQAAYAQPTFPHTAMAQHLPPPPLPPPPPPQQRSRARMQTRR